MLVMESKAKTGWPRGIWVFSAEHQNRVVLGLFVSKVIEDIFEDAKPELEHNETVSQIERAFRKHKFYTTREYPIYKIKDKSGRAGRIDLVARKGKFRVAVEYDHHGLIKWKSFQKIVQIKPNIAIGIAGKGSLTQNVERAQKYITNTPIYVISLKERRYKIIKSYDKE